MNFIHCDLPKSDVTLFFGKDEEAKEFNSFATLADIVMHMGKFTTVNQAKKNGWNKLIPQGFAKHRIGKVFFWTLNLWEGCLDG